MAAILWFFVLFYMSCAMGSPKEESGSSGSGCGCSLKRNPVQGSVHGKECSVGEDDGPNGSQRLDSAVSGVEEDMVVIKGRTFYMGTNKPQIQGDGEGPRREVKISRDFLLDRYQVTNRDYAEFVAATNYRTDSEIYGWSFVIDKAVPEKIRKGIDQAVLGAEWWLPVNGSYWKEPEGPGTDVFEPSRDRSNYPVVHISWTDAVEFCNWRNNSRLPTEAEWELAARGASDGQVFPWGNTLVKNKEYRANIFQGSFPKENTKLDGYEFLAPVDAYGPQNDNGLYNIIGNAWEWVSDWWTIDHPTEIQTNPTGPAFGQEKVKKGGSFLCHKSFCYRYRCAARYKTSIDSATQNSGLRCAKDLEEKNR